MANNNHLQLNLDTTAPQGTVTASAYYTAAGNVTLTYAADTTLMKVWYSSSATGSTSDANYPSAWEAVAASKTLTFSAEGTYYAHAQFKDALANVGNIANSSQFIYEVTGPTVNSVIINNGDAYTNHKANNEIVFTFTDPISGIVSGTISGSSVKNSPIDLALTSKEISAGTATRTFDFKDDTADGSQTVTITLTSAAGRTGTGSDSIILDTNPATGSITLRDATDAHNITGPINYTEIGARINCTDSDWTSWTLSGDFTGSPISGTVSAADKTNGYVFNAITLTSGDGVKTINGTITDVAGTVTTLTPVTIRVDKTAPVITASVGNAVISDKAGYNSTTLSMSVVEAVGQASYKVWLDSAESTPIDSGAGNLPASLTITNTTLGSEGTHTIHISVTDTAGNTGTKDVTIKLDTSGPVVGAVSITNYSGYIGGNTVESPYVKFNTITVSATASDTPAGVAKGYCWINSSATAASIPEGTTAKTSNFGTFDYSEINVAGLNEGGLNYAHVAYVDSVGNSTINNLASAVIIDTTLPGAGQISGLPAFCHKTINTITITPSDTNIAVGKGSYKIWGDITDAATEAAATWKSYVNAQVSITFTGSGASANKTVYIKWRDAAGNVQTATPTSATTELDTEVPVATLGIYDADDVNSIANTQRALNTFRAHISGVDETGGQKASYYLLYGSYIGGGEISPFTAGNAYAVNALVSSTVDGQLKVRKVTTAGTYNSWSALESASSDAFVALTYNKPDTGTKTHYLTDVLNGTTGDGTKTIKLRVRDDAGNVSDEVSLYYNYDATAPVVNIDSHDADALSKVHELIRTGTTGPYADKKGYADYVEFVFSVNERCLEWKVCAYLTQEAAAGGSHADPAIGNTNGSVNMTGTVIEANATVTAYLNGADYEAALGGTGHDGAHYIVVYVKDEGGTWSVAAQF